MGSLFGIGRAMDLLIYNALNAVAIILWRIDVTFISWGVMGYQTQDWLFRGSNSGAWFLFTRLIGGDGLVNIGVWEIFLTLALMIAGLTRLVRPFLQIRVVDLGRVLFYACATYILITQGLVLLQGAEEWRGEASGYIYTTMSQSPALILTMPGDPGGNPADDPVNSPRDLDGSPPIRGWEAVSSSYFLVSSANELHTPYPPAEFREVYCLYDPTRPMEDQGDVHDDQCNPAKVYDNWDIVSTGTITNIFGIPIPDLNWGFPIIEDHPENREEGIRRAQSGVARLAMGTLVALFPLIEANISLMLALAAVFIYINLPLVCLFSFFLPTEALVTRLIMQFITIFIRTIILHGLVGLFLLILVGVAATGSLTSYLGLIGVGLVGGFFLARIAAGIMTETLTQAFGSIGAIATGVAVGALGEGARKPTQAVMGAAQVGVTGAATLAGLKNTGLFNAPDLLEAAAVSTAQGTRQIAGTLDPETVARLQQKIPVALQGFVAPQNGQPMPQFGFTPDVSRNAQPQPDNRYAPASSPTLAGSSWSQNGGTSQNLVAAGTAFSPRDWTNDLYAAANQGGGYRAVAESARAQLGDDLVRVSPDVLKRHAQDLVDAVLEATDEVKRDNKTRFFDRRGDLTSGGVNAVRDRLDPETLAAFDGSGVQGRSDLAALVALGAQETQRPQPAAFRQKLSEAQPGTGEQSPAQTVPAALGLDNAAAGSSAASMNRFVRLSEEAGLSAAQRERLLAEAKGGDDISVALRDDLALNLGLKEKGDTQAMINDLVTSAQVLPETLEGPRRIRFSQELREAIRSSPDPVPTSPQSGQSSNNAPDARLQPARSSSHQSASSGPQVITAAALDDDIIGPEMPAASSTPPASFVAQPGAGASQGRPRFRVDEGTGQTGRFMAEPPSQPASDTTRVKKSRYETAGSPVDEDHQSERGGA